MPHCARKRSNRDPCGSIGTGYRLHQPAFHTSSSSGAKVPGLLQASERRACPSLAQATTSKQQSQNGNDSSKQLHRKGNAQHKHNKSRHTSAANICLNLHIVVPVANDHFTAVAPPPRDSHDTGISFFHVLDPLLFSVVDQPAACYELASREWPR